MVPRRPQVSVIRGACMFGLNPRSITSRISKMTYGINTLTTWDMDKHPEEKKVIIEGEDFCEDVFDAFVRKGEAVGIDEVHEKTYCPVRARRKADEKAKRKGKSWESVPSKQWSYWNPGFIPRQWSDRRYLDL